MSFLTDDASIIALRGWAERQGYPQATVQQGGPDMFANLLESAPPPKLAVVDIDGQSDPVARVTRMIEQSGRECRLVIVGSTNDVGLFRKIITAGAVDYLVKPLAPEHINHSLAVAQRGGSAGQNTIKEARLIAVIGSRGGVGASTIALNIGWLLAHSFKRSTALVDLDLQYGTSALALDLEPGRGLRDIVGSPHRVDNLMISSSMVSESDLFSVLGAEESIDEIIPMDGGAITALLKEIKASFETIIIDIPHHSFAQQKRLFPMAHEIVLVSELTLSGIRDTLRLKNAILTLGCSANLTIVASRTNASGAGQIDRAVFEKGIQAKIGATIVEDAVTMKTAANSGKALGEVALRAPITKAIRDLAENLTPSEAKFERKASFLDKLLGKNKAARSPS